MTKQEIIRKIEIYEERTQVIRQRLETVSDPNLRAGLERDLRIFTVFLFTLTNELKEMTDLGVVGRHQRAAAGAESRA